MTNDVSNCRTRLTPETPKTCRYLRRISMSRHLWLSMVKELDYDCAPNLLPYESIQSLSLERLREMVIRSTRTFLNWTSPYGPKATRSVSIEILEKDTFYRMLLPGGKYFVFLTDDQFHCYDTESQLKICSQYGVASPEHKMKCINCLLVDDGDTIILAYGTFRDTDGQR